RPTQLLRQLQDLGFQLLATAGGGGGSLHRHSFAPRSLLILGAEGTGVSKPLLELAEQVLKIPGNSSVESLNVSVACGICLGEYYRQRPDTHDPRPAQSRK
ncbi:MAG: TrmH family RNA methyltransferase, partial [Gammaproteobacteria bacterium]